MLCWGLTSVPPDGTSLLLGHSLNIVEVSQMMFPLLGGQAPPFEEVLDWFQFSYTKDWMGAYMAPASTVLVQSMVLEGDPIFSLIWRRLCLSLRYSIYPFH